MSDQSEQDRGRPGRVAIGFLISFNIALGVIVLFMLSRGYQVPKPDALGQVQVLEYKDFISILLTALAVMIAVATLMAAAAAIWGFDLLRKETRQAAIQTAEKEARTVAELVAKDVAETVATRTARATPAPDTTEQEASELVEALGAQEEQS